MKRRFPGVLRLLLQGLAALAKQDNLSTQCVRKVCRTSGDQTLAKQWLPIFKKNMGKRGGKRGGGGTLWSQVVAPAHARCVFYCFLIIVQLLLGRIYWNRQPARLLTAYEADTSCVTAAAVRRGKGGGQKTLLMHACRWNQEQQCDNLAVKMKEACYARLLVFPATLCATFSKALTP